MKRLTAIFIAFNIFIYQFCSFASIEFPDAKPINYFDNIDTFYTNVAAKVKKHDNPDTSVIGKELISCFGEYQLEKIMDANPTLRSFLNFELELFKDENTHNNNIEESAAISNQGKASSAKLHSKSLSMDQGEMSNSHEESVIKLSADALNRGLRVVYQWSLFKGHTQYSLISNSVEVVLEKEVSFAKGKITFDSKETIVKAELSKDLSSDFSVALNSLSNFSNSEQYAGIKLALSF